MSETYETPRKGTLLELTESYANNPAGTTGLIYHVEEHRGVQYYSVLLSNGTDVGQFTILELELSFQVIGHQNLLYFFASPSQLQQDYKSGVFTSCFSLIASRQV